MGLTSLLGCKGLNLKSVEAAYAKMEGRGTEGRGRGSIFVFVCVFVKSINQLITEAA